MTPDLLLEKFSPSVKRKARALALAEDTPIVPDGLDVFPQAWRVKSADRSSTYTVRLVCEPGPDALAEREIHGSTCTCPNGQNSTLGTTHCYHVAAVLSLMAAGERRAV